jgi:hypothetical protein
MREYDCDCVGIIKNVIGIAITFLPVIWNVPIGIVLVILDSIGIVKCVRILLNKINDIDSQQIKYSDKVANLCYAYWPKNRNNFIY